MTTDHWVFKREVSIGDIVAVVLAAGAVVSAYLLHDRRITTLEERMSSSVQFRTEVVDELKLINLKLERLTIEITKQSVRQDQEDRLQFDDRRRAH